MTLERNDKMGAPDEKLLIMLADINSHMMAIRQDLGSNPSVVEATRGCDVRRYRDPSTEQGSYCFEAYVEAKTQTGDVFSWSLDITLVSLGWNFQRRIAKQTRDGEQIERAFDDRTYEDLDDFADKITTLMVEFAGPAKNFSP